ncbi:GH36-type glycosyl hydrolase domain-containing protein [Serinicoccus kebangsaanensis]|uniref:GH36-type glycosyl hydrolase domain-containing protein n=1 Tax=Serinicoccus kebangsaanensis TaxID=2602069 RepID=UPI00124E5A69|nr:hypothetical protein [Serinicoccus kebangsaanensis]
MSESASGEDASAGPATILRSTSSGALRSASSQVADLLLYPASELEDGVAGLWLRRRDHAGIHPLPLVGTASDGPVAHVQVDGAVARVGRDLAGGLAWRWVRRAHHDSPGWTWTVEVTNTGASTVEVDLLCVQDLALAGPGAVAGSALYVSQYLDVTPVDVGERGTALAIRQNMPGPTSPWGMLGCLTGADAFATDAIQLTGRGRVEGEPWPGLAQELPSARFQREHTLAALTSRPHRLAPGESLTSGFFVVTVADHPDASGPDDARHATGIEADDLGLVVGRPGEDAAGSGPAAPRSLFAADRPGLRCRQLTTAELEQAVGPAEERRQVELDEGIPISWFTPEGDHVVTPQKQAAVLRPHGQLLRTGDRLVPDERDVTTTVWMDGSFCSQLAQGHVSLGVLTSLRRSYLGLNRAHGLRLFVDDGQGWALLGTPSLWSNGFDHATWWYARGERILRVRTTAPAAGSSVTVEVDQLAGDPVPVLVALGIDWAGAPGQVGAVGAEGPDEVLVTAPPGSNAARSSAASALRLRWSVGALDVPGDDGPLFDDGASRGEPWVTATVTPHAAWTLELSPRLSEVDGEPAAPAADAFWTDLGERLALSAPGGDGPAATSLSALVQVLPWFAHDALVHYLSPRGLEQHTGGAWGTRDVSQGPVGLLRSLGEHGAWRDLLLLVLGAQQERGDWPQAFDFLPRHRSTGLGDAHGDVVYWPLLATGQYLQASGDTGLLTERVPFAAAEEGRDATVGEHLRRAVDAVEGTLIEGTGLPAYGHGDWNDSLQPADPSLARRMVSTWTVVLQAHALRTLAEGVGGADPELAERCRAIADRGVTDLRRHLLVDGVLAGYGVREEDGSFRPLIHPRDEMTGLTYSVLPIIHAISGDLLTPEEVRRHTRIVREHLTGPDGARLFDRPVAYRGGPMEIFQRAEASTFFGREVGIMYMHAHLRWAEALARLGDGPGLLHALAQANPVGLQDVVAPAQPRQANTYFSSSDAAVADRVAAAEQYAEVVAGEVPLESGWRVYSSGPGLFLEIVTQHLLGVRHHGDLVHLDPVLDPALGTVQAELTVLGRRHTVRIHPGARGHGPVTVRAGSTDLTTTPLDNPYRTAGVAVRSDDLAAALGSGAALEVHCA